MGKTRKSPAFPKRHLYNVASISKRIHVYNRQKDLPISSAAVKDIMRLVLDLEKAEYQEISIYFASVKKICALHQEFFQDPTPTDCISFPIDAVFLGEVFVCPKVAIQYAQKSQTDPYEEVALYIIHGLLHLLGYDDLTAPERRIMRKKEKKCMSRCIAMINRLRVQ